MCPPFIRFSLPIFLLVGATALHGQQTRSNLIVGEGKTDTLEIRSYYFDTIRIAPNATLKIVQGGDQWVHLKAKYMEIHGKIEYTGMRRSLGLISNGSDLNYVFPETSVGGKGGEGASNGFELGGTGYAFADSAAGGGGGSGAQGNEIGPFPGLSATSGSGAVAADQEDVGWGGNGGVDSTTNGGLLCLEADTIFFGDDASIVLHGGAGTDGQPGGKGICDPYVQNVGGGGGGGSAGGDGGVLVVRYLSYNRKPIVDISGGEGGKGGKKGLSSGCGYKGTDGDPGQKGEDGHVSWLNISEQ
jgi:hypothetical protein